MPRLHFVQELPVGSSRRDQELERSKARAHAASVSYQNHHHQHHHQQEHNPPRSQPQSETQARPRVPPDGSHTLDADDDSTEGASFEGGQHQHRHFSTRTETDTDAGHGLRPPWDDDGGGGGGHESGPSSTLPLSTCRSLHGLQTPPQSPQDRDPEPDPDPGRGSGVVTTGPIQSWPADAVADLTPSETLTPPDSHWLESGVVDVEGEGHGEGERNPRRSGHDDMEDMVALDRDYSSLDRTAVIPSSSSSSSALIFVPQKRRTPRRSRIYQLNPHIPTQSPAQSSMSNNAPWATIPHDLLGTRADPFDCIPRRHAHSASVAGVVDYHAQIMAPNHAPIYKIFDVTNVYTAYYFELLAHPDFLYTGVASVQAIIDHLRRTPATTTTTPTTQTTPGAGIGQGQGQGPSENVLRHIGTAMGRLRKRLGRVQKEIREEEDRKKGMQRLSAKERKKGNIIINDMDFVPGVQRSDEPLQEEHTKTGAANPKRKKNNNIHDNKETLPVDDMTIMTVLFLAVVTRAINDLPSHEIHKKTLASLVAARGGLQNLIGHDGLARCTLMQWESFWALNTGASIFPESRPGYRPQYPPSPIPASSPLGQKVSVLPSGFQALTHQRRLALDVLEVLSRTAAAHVEQMQHGTIVTPSDVFRTKPRRFQDFWEACTCLGAPDEVDPGGRVEDGVMTMIPNLEKLIVLALLLYCLHTFSPMRAVTAVYNGSRMKLTTDAPRRARRTPVMALILTPGISSPLDSEENVARVNSGRQMTMETELDKIEREEDVLLWIWFNLVDSWRAANDTLLPQGVQIMHELRLRFSERTATWEGCESILTGFFWNDRFIQRCRAFWMVSERRENG